MINFLIKRFDVLMLCSLFIGGTSFFLLYYFSWIYGFCGDIEYVFYSFLSYVLIVLSGELFFLGLLFLLVNIFKRPGGAEERKQNL